MLRGAGLVLLMLATRVLGAAERHATRIILLMGGRVRLAWDTAELTATRDHPEHSLEDAMAAACAA